MSYNNPSRKHVSRLSTPVRLGVAAVAACFISAPVLSLPVSPTVVNGVATFNQAGNVLTVTNSNGAIINWQQFNIAKGETTHFAQTSASSTVMNRVLANDPSLLYGTMSSNGRVWLVNPAGIFVGPSGRIDVAGFVASTLNIRNEDFLAGRNVFINDGSAQNVINQGEIRTPAGGSVYLIGSNVVNEGIIVTPKGETILAAGATVSLIDSATPGVKVDITGVEGNATNLGSITAEAGRIGIAGVIVRNSGTLNASSVVAEGGRVFLKASQDAYVDGNGRIVTTGTRGGSVEVLGNRVAVMDNAEIDASGENGGGRIMVGGDYQGKNPDIQNASISYFGPNASLKADATEVGDGGTVIVWADDTTRAYGSISARGGALGGNGGFVETSGHRSLSVTGARVDTRAPNGATGNWLLDPTDISIISGGSGSVLGSVFDPGINSTITDADVNFALGYSSLIIQTSGGSGGVGNISAGGVNIYGGNSLTLAAYGGGSATGNIDIYGGSTINVGGFTALAGWYGGTTYTKSDVIEGKGNITISASQIYASGNIDLHAGKDIKLGHTTTSSAGTWIEAAGTMLVSAQNLSLYGGSAAMFNISSPQGPGVMLKGFEQEIEVDNQILLQAGSANNTFYGGFGSMFYGGSVTIQSLSDQQIEATVLKLVAGAQGHDNAATVDANGDQLIVLGSSGSPGQLIITGGGGNTATYGGTTGYGGVGSYNNFAELRQGGPTGSQVIILESAGSTVQLKGGDGTGYGGYFNMNPASEGWSSNNYASIHNQGTGANNGGYGQVIDFHYGGTLTVTGGTAGNANFASIGNNSESKLVIGSINAVDTASALANLPAITIYGGASGGKDDFAGGDNLSNSADIYSDALTALTQISGSLITITAGGNATTIGGAGIGASNLLLRTPGNLTMTGGGSNLVTALPIPGAATAAYISTDESSAGVITIEAGGNISLVAGNGYGGAVLIGSVNDAPSSTTIDIGAYGGITLTSGTNSSVAIGNMSPAGYGGADVTLRSIGNLTATGSANAPVMIGSLNGGTNPTNVTLGSMRDVTLTKANVGSWNGDAASIAVYGGFMENGGPSPYGGSLSFTSTKFGSALGDAAIGFYAAAYGGAGGNISFSDGGGAYGASIDIVAARDLQLGTPTASKGVRLQTTTGLMSITANNFYAYGGSGIRGPNDVNLIGDPVPYGGAGIGVLAGTAGQTITVAGTLLLQAGAISNPNGSGSSYYGGSVTFLSAGNQSISAGTLKLAAGTAGHDNVAQIIGEGATQDITVSTLLDLKGGGGGNNNYAWIGATGASGVQTIDASGASIVLTGGTSGGAPNQENGADISLSDMTNTGGSQTVFAGNITINGGSSTTTYGGAGFGTGNGLDQSFYVTGDLTMNGGASPAYIGSEYGGGTITVQVGGKIALTGGSGTYGGVLIGSLDDSLGVTTVNLSAGKGITATGATGGVLLGVKNLTGATGNSVTLNAGWNGIAPSSYGGDITLTGPVGIQTDGTSGAIDIVAHESSAGVYGSVSLGAGTVAYGNSIGIVAAGNNDVAGLLISTGEIYLDAGWDDYAQNSSLRGGNLTLASTSNLQMAFGYMYAQAGTNASYGGGSITQYGSLAASSGISLYADRDIGINGSVVSYGSDIYLSAGYSETNQFGGNISLAGTLSGYGGVGLFAEAGYSSGLNGNITQTSTGSITAATGSVTIAGHGNVTLNGSVTASTGGINASAGIIDGGEGGYASLYGGSLSVGSTGNILAFNTIDLLSSKDIALSGPVTSTNGSVSITAGRGYSGYFGTYSSPFGGNVTIGNTISGYNVNISASVGYESHANGNITQTSGSILANNSINIAAGGSVGLGGTTTANYGYLSVRAGYQAAYFGNGDGYSSGVTPYGGNISVSGALSGEYGVTLVAESGSSSGLNGNITQYGSSITAGFGDVRIIGGGNVTLNGSIDGGEGGCCSTAVTVKAGFSDYTGTVTPYGGNISLAATSAINGYGGVYLYAESGSASGANGNITQNVTSTAKSAITAYGGDVAIFGGGNVTLNGSASAYGGSGSVRAGHSAYGGMASANGGNITVSGKLFADYDLELFASAGSSSGLNGNITQSSGSISSANNNIGIYADGNVNLNGLVTAPDSLYIRAGVDNAYSMGSYSYTSQYGGNIALGASSRVYGGFVGLAANGGYYGGISATGSSTGNISQTAGGQLMTSGSNSLYGYAAGNVELLGSIIASSTAYIDAGRDLTGGGRYAFANKHITISSLEADDSSVYLTATGPISANTKNASSIFANIDNSSSGGIEISNTGAAQPGSVNLQDNATANSAVTFTHTGSDVSVNGSMSFTTYGGLGDILIAAPANKLTYYGAGTLSGANVLLGAGSVLNMYGGLTTVGTLGLSSGGSLNIDSPIGGSYVTLVAPTVNIGSAVTATADAIVTGSTIDVYGGSVTGANILFRGAAFGTGNLTLSSGGYAEASGQLEFNLANVDAYGGHLAATSSTSNITGFVSGNITLDNGAYFLAGDDIDLTLTGSTSTISLSNGAHMVSDVASGTVFTTFLNFIARSGDGVKIDGTTTTTSTPGGSGFFVFDQSTPATTTSGGGLVITYANAVIVDPCAASPDLCKPPSPVDNPVVDVVEADPCATSPDSAQCKAQLGEKEKDEKDSFGDEATDGKKDEKSSQKKVAQCGV